MSAVVPGAQRSLDGLDAASVAERVGRGQVNRVAEVHSRSYAAILRANVLTRFNALLGALLVAALVIGPIQDTAFGLVLLSNTAIGVVQEVRAKRTLDRLAVLSTPRVTVRRDGDLCAVDVGDVVLDDVVALHRGDQLVVDGALLAADGLEVDESLLSGEAEPVAKSAGDEVLSGSFVVAGSGAYRATRVGAEAYARQLAARARVFRMVRSELRDGINTLLRVISFGIPPAAVLLVITQLRANPSGEDAARVSIAGLVALVPEGLVLLTSLAFAIAVVRLGRRKALVQDLPAVEMLARVDVVCLDKTGTLTDGTIRVHSVDALRPDAPVAAALGSLAAYETAANATMLAVAARFPAPADGWTVVSGVPFSSARRWSAIAVQGEGTYVLGAADVLPVGDAQTSALASRIDGHMAAGRRVLLLAWCTGLDEGGALPGSLTPVAVVAFEETLRSDAATTVRYFLDQGVAVKVISGDDPHTVAAIAAAAGVPGADTPLDARTLPAEMSAAALGDVMEASGVIGRVAPQQKRAMVLALQQRGHVVAMTGDGVNDVLALKDADIGIAMGSGSGASRAVAQIVLVDGRFATLPFAVAEGRRVIANVERVGKLFLTKTAYALALIIAVGVASLPFPLLARHLTLVASLTVGIPAFFLALAPTAQRARPGFVPRILRFAVPTGAIVAVGTFLAYWLSLDEPGVTLPQARTMAATVLLLSGLWIVLVIARPLNGWKRLLVGAMLCAFAVAVVAPPLRALFGIAVPDLPVVLTAVGIAAVAVAAIEVSARVERGSGHVSPGRAAPPGG